MKKQVLSFLHFQFQKILLFFEGKKMRFSLSALQFGKELLEVKAMQRRNNSVEILVLPRIKKRRKFLKLGVGYIHRFMFIY